ncbi:histone acetyltransferase type B [Sistotremastrum niveocremeum HHB9708]|uniref:Histone acetyltransferase type B catalytic subunit n=1 Tax=Sistotremastrum niveocremeum HHB9708 TaxID=1314777 RepID=A0A165AEA2_9AGAM|nr:histone acetyltransferase type B [Sistotremastrum niveocremeum HHB9708]
MELIQRLFLCVVDGTQLGEGEESELEIFNPSFTYPIFGNEEKIYGYKGLSIQLHFASGSLAQYLNVSYKSKIKARAAIDDVEGTLYKFIPPDYYKSETEFLKRVAKDAVEFKPLGNLIHTYTRRKRSGDDEELVKNGDNESDEKRTFEVYHVSPHTTWETPGFREYHRRMQIFILLYIEGGSYIQEDEDRWEFVVLYEKKKTQREDGQTLESYHFVGYSSLYPFWFYEDKTRLRLSQFVVLPPYQKQGHGSALYNAIYANIVSRETVAELTVEDPSEAFEDLRDKNDLLMLLKHEQFNLEGFGPGEKDGVKKKGKLGPPADKPWVEKWRRDLKIAGRQFARLVEMLILRSLDPLDAQARRAYRLQVKERLYRFNYEQLIQLEKEERLEKLEETFQNVHEDYQRLLALVD